MFTQEFITLIITLSATTTGITQAIKKWSKTDGVVAVIISAIVSVVVTFWYSFSETAGFDAVKFIVLVVCVFLQSNGFYHFGSYAIGKRVTEVVTKEKK